MVPDELDRNHARMGQDFTASRDGKLIAAVVVKSGAQRAEILARSGQWGLAAAAFGAAVQREPKKRSLRFSHVIALVESGNRAGLRLACVYLLKTFGNSADPTEAMRIAGFCRLAPDAIDDRQKLEAIRGLALDGWRFVILVHYGQARPMIAVIAKAIEGEPDVFRIRYVHLLTLLEAGDIAGYRRAAEGLLSHFGKVTSPGDINNVAWYCLLAPDAVADRDAPLRLAERALAAYPEAKKSQPLNTLARRSIAWAVSTIPSAGWTSRSRPGDKRGSRWTGPSWPWPITAWGIAPRPARGSTSFNPTSRRKRPAHTRGTPSRLESLGARSSR